MRKRGGEIPKWTKGADCKSAAIGFGGSNPPLPMFLAQSSTLEVVSSLELSAMNLIDAGIAQLVERQPSKLDVAGSNPVSRSIG